MGLFSTLLGSSTDWNPNGGPTNDFWYDNGAGNSLTQTGLRITPENALQVSAVFACLKVIAETMGTLPLIVYERVNEREKKRAYGTPEFKLFAKAPNAWQTPYDFKENLTAWAALHGGGFATKVPSDDFTTGELDPVHPALVRVEKLPSRRLRYWIRQPDGTEKPHVQGEIFHLRGFAPNGITGLNLSQSAREAIAIARAMEMFSARYFANDATIGIVLEHPNTLKPEAHRNLQSSFNMRHGGVANAWRPKILEEGMKLHRLESKAKDAQLTEGREAQVIEICRYFRVPPHKVAHLIHATFSNIEHQGIEFVTDTITPWAVRWEEAVTRDIILDDEKYFAEFLLTALLRGDNAARAAYYQARFNTGTMSRNDIRASENENPIEGGDVYYIQGAMVPLDSAGRPIHPERPEPPRGRPTDEEEEREAPKRTPQLSAAEAASPALRILLADAADRIARAEQRELEKRADKASDASRFNKWAESFYTEHAAYAARTLAPLTEALSALGGPKLDAAALAEQIAGDGLLIVSTGRFAKDPASAIAGRGDRVSHLITIAFFPPQEHANAA